MVSRVKLQKNHSRQKPNIVMYIAQRFRNNPRFRAGFLVGVFSIVGVVLVVLSHAQTPATSLEAEDGTTANVSIVSPAGTSGGGAVCFGSQATCVSGRMRFFADDASWNKTVSQVGGEFTQLQSFAQRLYDYGGGVKNGPSPNIMSLSIKDYSTPIYNAADATTTARVFQVVWSQNQQNLSHSGFSIGDTIPWNDSWKPGTGNDNIMSIINYQTGKVYELWGVGQAKPGCFDFFGPNNAAGYDGNNPTHLCMAGVETYDNLWTAKDGSTVIGRGMGINKMALIVRADEVATGDIGHALPLTISNPMFGPTMVSPAYDGLQAGAGVTKGFYMKPATRLEHMMGTTIDLGSSEVTPLTDEQRAKTVPSGMRFAIRITEPQITAWLDSKNYTGKKRESAQTFARAWRDYGAIVAETGGWGIGIETDGVIGPAKSKWQALGLYDVATDTVSNIAFDGLITRDNLYVVKPPL